MQGATGSLVKTVAAAQKNAIPKSMLERAQKLLKEGAPHYIRPPEGDVTIESGSVLISDEEEQRKAEEELERALSRALSSEGPQCIY